jgi:hypothetical protein
VILTIKHTKKVLGPHHGLTGNRGCRWTAL